LATLELVSELVRWFRSKFFSVLNGLEQVVWASKSDTV